LILKVILNQKSAFEEVDNSKNQKKPTYEI